jgi:hypothetical protein
MIQARSLSSMMKILKLKNSMRDPKEWLLCSIGSLSPSGVWKWVLGFLGAGTVIIQAERVELIRTPDEGIQPQAAVDAHGVLHLIYYKGDPMDGDLFYVRREPGRHDFSSPIQVNSQPGSAIAAGGIRGAQMAVGKKSRVHVAWNGGAGAVRPLLNGEEIIPMLYTRLNGQGTAFEQERNLITRAAGLDGGGAVAADSAGNVYVAWHGSPPGNQSGEGGRAVFVARSLDEGKTFQSEREADPEPKGACACCGMRALAGRDGGLFILYRSAYEMLNRDSILLSSEDGTRFEAVELDKWNIGACPMSGFGLAEGNNGVLAAWETAGQVSFKNLSAFPRISEPVPAPGTGKRKHPALAVNSDGGILLAWAEGTGWARGGRVAWQLFDQHGQPMGKSQTAEGLPVWSFPSAAASRDGRFLLVY